MSLSDARKATFRSNLLDPEASDPTSKPETMAAIRILVGAVAEEVVRMGYRFMIILEDGAFGERAIEPLKYDIEGPIKLV